MERTAQSGGRRSCRPSVRRLLSKHDIAACEQVTSLEALSGLKVQQHRLAAASRAGVGRPFITAAASAQFPEPLAATDLPANAH
jgi:hypothetical protein